MSQWEKKVVVVTGGSDGLGLAIVEAFGRLGANVVSLARNQERNEAIASRLNESSLQVTAIQADMTDLPQVENAVRQIEERYGRIDVWVNNVGMSTRANVATTTVDDYADFMRVNFYSSVNGWQASRTCLEKSSGALVNIGSLASKTGWPLMAPYSASKHALAAFTHQLRLEGPEKVAFIHVCPGPIKRKDSSPRYVDEHSDLPKEARTAGAGARVDRAGRARRPRRVGPDGGRDRFGAARPGRAARLALRRLRAPGAALRRRRRAR